MKKIAIVGSRNFNNFDLMNKVVFQDYIEKNGLYAEDVMIISGGANGADKLAEKLAQLRGYKLVVFKADWNKYGKKAGMIRNSILLKVLMLYLLSGIRKVLVLQILYKEQLALEKNYTWRNFK